MSDPVKASQPRHVPVMPHEVMHYLTPAAGQIVVDATVGAGGHTRLLAAAVAPSGRILGLDRDAVMLELARPTLSTLPITLIHRSFDELPEVLRDLGIERIDAVVADLGICSDQLDDPSRGLSFQQEGPLDMRMDTTQGEPASALVNSLSERELADLIFKYGEERFSRRIARRIVETRRRTPIERT